MADNKKKKKRSLMDQPIQTKILIPFLILLIVTVGTVALVSYQSSAANTTEELTRNVEGQMAGMSDTFDLFFDNISNHLNRIVKSELIYHFDSDKENELLHYMRETQESNSAITNIYLVLDETGETIIYPYTDLSDFNPLEREWYQHSLTRKDVVWTEPYIDASSEEYVVTASRAVYDTRNNLIGAVGVDVNLNTLTNLMNGLTIGETGYGTILDETGSYVVHPNVDMIGVDQSEEKFYQEMIAQDIQGTVEHETNGKSQITAFAKNPTTDWIIGGTVNVEEFEEKARDILPPIIITLIIMIILTIAITYWITNRITRRIRTVMERMNEVASGNLESEPLEVQVHDETGELMNATNKMSNNMRDVLLRIQNVSETVTGRSEELKESSNEVTLSSEQVASTMQEISAGSETQANHTGELSTNMESFSEKVRVANESGASAQDSAQDVLTLTDEGASLMASSTEQMETIDQVVQEAAEKVGDLDSHAVEISQLVSVIQDIATQTNLLALNASIEAARAGEYGKGFAVVADEVGKLAEESANSVTHITEIVERIQNESASVAASLQESYEDVAEGRRQIVTTGETFSEIRSAVMTMSERINHVATNLDDITSNTQDMNTSIQEVAAVSEESAAGIEQIAASTEQTSSSMEEVAASSEALANLADELNELINRFKL